MRMLLYVRGLPASGKSKFIKDNGLEPYTVSSDNLRVLLGSYSMNVSGDMVINQGVSKYMWNMLYGILEDRFKIGAFTVFDATNIKGADMQKVNKLAKQYRYRSWCVDFTDVSAEECIRRDAERPVSQRVGSWVINRMAEDLKNNQVPGGIKVIRPDEWLEETQYRVVDLSQYKKIVHIGDIHGCYSALRDYLQGNLNPEYFYIFIGDYIDRGLENVQMTKIMGKICQFDNVVLLEGNHEKNLRAYLAGEKTNSEDFEEHTRVEFDTCRDKERLEKDIKSILSKLRQCIIYEYDGRVVLCTHGGLSSLPENLSFVNTEQMIKGVGLYKDMLLVNESFAKQNENEEIYQVHGHRNVEQVPIRVNENCFNLCEHIEYGGNLRCLELDSEGFHEVYTPNPVFRKRPEGSFATVGEMLDVLDMNKNIKAVEQDGYNITSYNFTREAFNHGVWDDITTKARGLFINNNTSKIVARGYDKFFNINERPETNITVIPNTVCYPVTAYRKENGFLGLLGYDEESDSLLFCSKSEIGGKFATYFKDILLSRVSEHRLKDYLKGRNVTLVFEVVDTHNDPHIIKYAENSIYLLDIIENTVMFKNYDYSLVADLAQYWSIPCKERCKVLNSAEELVSFFEEIRNDNYKYNGDYIEGFVFVDKHNFMFKFKCAYYKYWKYMRSQLEYMAKGGSPKEMNSFLKWVSKDKSRCKRDIISLREEYLSLL